MSSTAKSVGLYLYENVEKEIATRGENRSHIINRDLERLYSLYRRALREIPLEFKEACLIVDSLNGSTLDANSALLLCAEIEDACKLDDLDKKWGIDADALIAKLTGLSLFHRIALIDASEKVWEVPDDTRDLEKEVRKHFNIKS